MSQEFNVRIQGKIDTQNNFEASQEIYLDGELLTVRMNDGSIKFKVGDGKSIFSKLKYTDEHLLEEINKKSNINSPTFTGIPQAPTPSEDKNDNQIATTKFVKDVVKNNSISLEDLGITATASEINKLDGATITTQELNYLSGATNNIQEQLDDRLLLTPIEDIPKNSNLNDYTKTGNYYIGAGAISATIENTAMPNNGYVLVVSSPYGPSSASRTQYAISSNGIIRFRSLSSGSWSSWGDIFSTANKPKATQIVEDETHRFITDSERTLWNNSIDGVVAYYPTTRPETDGILDVSTDTTMLVGVSSTVNKEVYELFGSSISFVFCLQLFYSTISATTTRSQIIIAGDGRIASRYKVGSSGSWTAWRKYADEEHTHNYDAITGMLANRALVSNASGGIAVSAVTSTEIGYLDGATSNIQTQLNGKAASSHEQDFCGTGDNTYIAYPKDGRLRLKTSSNHGYIKILLPENIAWRGTFVSFTVDVWGMQWYNGSFKAKISGYVRNDKTWGYIDGFITANRKCPYKNLPIHFGRDGERPAIYIGNIDTGWPYPQVTIKDISLGWTYNAIEDWIEGWDVSISSEEANIDFTISNTSSSHFAGLTAGRAIISNAAGELDTSVITTAELGYLDGVTSNIQTQINNLKSGGGPKIVVQSSQPSGLVAGDFWYQIV